jgi:hypothetical protein
MTSKAFILVKFVTKTGDKITIKYRNRKQNVQKNAILLNFFLKTAQNAYILASRVCWRCKMSIVAKREGVSKKEYQQANVCLFLMRLL